MTARVRLFSGFLLGFLVWLIFLASIASMYSMLPSQKSNVLHLQDHKLYQQSFTHSSTEGLYRFIERVIDAANIP